MSDQPASVVIEHLSAAARAAAATVARKVGSGDMMALDGAAVRTLRLWLGGADIDAEVAVGEGAKDGAPMLAPGERLGRGEGSELDLAVDPLDGTRAAAEDRPGALVALGAAPRAAMVRAPELYYVEKLVVGPQAADCRGGTPLVLDDPIETTLHRVAERLQEPVASVSVGILDRPRNAALIGRVEATGARVARLQADLPASVAVAAPRAAGGLDVVAGIGGFPEAMVAACALGCLGGQMWCRPWIRHEDERPYVRAHGLDRVLGIANLVGTRGLAFAAAGVTQTALLAGAVVGSTAVDVEWIAFDSDHTTWTRQVSRVDSEPPTGRSGPDRGDRQPPST